MTALNLEVDPKRIEAHENEEPPAYEPTDLVEEEEPTEKNDKPDSNESGKDYNGVFEGEVVEEDAEEERKAEARAMLEREKAASKKKASDADQEEEAGFSKFGEAPARDGPSMDDFFGDSYGDDENGTAAKKEESSKRAAKKTTKKETVSLVPKKTNARSRRPKIRPSRRKK